MITVTAFVVAALIPLGFLVVVKSFDFYQTGSAKFIIYSVVWGVISYLLAAQINPALVRHGVFTTDTVVRFARAGDRRDSQGADPPVFDPAC